MNDWGALEDDGVENNASCLEQLVGKGVTALPAVPQPTDNAAARFVVCCSSGQDPSSPVSRQDAQRLSGQHLKTTVALPAASIAPIDGAIAGMPSTGVASDLAPSRSANCHTASTIISQLPSQSVVNSLACPYVTSSDGVKPSMSAHNSAGIIVGSTVDKLDAKVANSPRRGTATLQASVRPVTVPVGIMASMPASTFPMYPVASKSAMNAAIHSAASSSSPPSGMPMAAIPSCDVAIGEAASRARWHPSALPASSHGALLSGHTQPLPYVMVPVTHYVVRPSAAAAPDAIPAQPGYQHTLHGHCRISAPLVATPGYVHRWPRHAALQSPYRA